MNKVEEKDLKSAAGYALIEAKKWSSVARMITTKGYEKEQVCIQILAIEIYFKSILMCEGTNISKINNRKENGHNAHHLYDLYNRMNKETKIKLKEDINFTPIHERNPLMEEIKYDFNTFEEALEGVSNNFVDLRYEYDKFVNGQPIYIMCDFVNKLEEKTKKLAQESYNNII